MEYNQNNLSSRFTGRIIHPVIIRREDKNETESKLEINYCFGDCSCQSPPEEDWTLPLEACEKNKNDKLYYDIWVQGKLIAEAPDIESAKQEMEKYIDDKGYFKCLEK